MSMSHMENSSSFRWGFAKHVAAEADSAADIDGIVGGGFDVGAEALLGLRRGNEKFWKAQFGAQQ